MAMDFSNIKRVLFQGDSITDAGRSADGKVLGHGYAGMLGKYLKEKYPHLEITNKGVSGNRAIDLVNRLDEDFIAHDPEFLSIMIGINDTWRAFDSGEPTTREAYEASYRKVLERCSSELSCKIIMIEPFVLPTPEDRLTWRDDLDAKIEVARKLADEFADYYVPMDSIFESALSEEPAPYWADDGVHPTREGHERIAKSWIETVEKD